MNLTDPVSRNDRIFWFPNSSRRKVVSRKTIFKVLTATLFLIILVLASLTFYTPYILLKEYIGQPDRYKKVWLINPIIFLRDNIELLLTNNHAAMINVLFAHEHQSESVIPTLKVVVNRNSLEELNHKILLNYFH